jgi:hypothetical protein
MSERSSTRPLGLLGRHVAQRPHEQSRAREILLRRSDPRDAEIENLGHPIARDEDVARLDVAMDDPVLVGIREAVADLHHQRQLALEGQILALADHLPQLLPFQVLHDDEQAPRILAQVVDGDDVGVAQPCAGLRLAEKARAQLIARVHVLGDDLEGDHALQQGVVRLVHGAHASLPDLLYDLVLAESFDHRPLDLFGAHRTARNAPERDAGPATGRRVHVRLTARRVGGRPPLIKRTSPIRAVLQLRTDCTPGMLGLYYTSSRSTTT